MSRSISWISLWVPDPDVKDTGVKDTGARVKYVESDSDPLFCIKLKPAALVAVIRDVVSSLACAAESIMTAPAVNDRTSIPSRCGVSVPFETVS